MKKTDLSWMWHCSSVSKNILPDIDDDLDQSLINILQNGGSIGFRIALSNLSKLGLITLNDINRSPNEEDQKTWDSKLKNPKPEFSEEELEKIQMFKLSFQDFFEGKYSDGFQYYDNYININVFGINNLEFKFKDDVMYIVISLDRPGLLIGKGGHTIDSLINFLNERIGKIKIELIERSLWN